MKETGVIVLGGHVQGYGIVKIFGENNIPSVVMDTTNLNIARHSKYCVASYCCSYEEFPEMLESFRRKNLYKNWILIPTDDYYVRILSRSRDKLNEYFKVSVDSWDVIEKFYNKSFSYPLAESCGIPVPKTLYPASPEDLNELRSRIEFPCIIKPAVMRDFYNNFRKKVFVCRVFDELVSNYKKANTIIKAEEILIQEIIPGSNENQYSVGIFFDRDRSYNYLAGRRKRQHPVDFGNATTFAETVEIPLLIEYSEKLLRKARFQGICEVEFKLDERDGKYKFLEVNPRTWKWHLISENAGVPFLMSLYKFMTEGNALVTTGYGKASWQDIVTDLPIQLGLMMRKKLNKSVIKNKQNAVMNTKDIKPFLFQLGIIPYLLIKR
jgi:D-aspartate ligase